MWIFFRFRYTGTVPGTGNLKAFPLLIIKINIYLYIYVLEINLHLVFSILLLYHYSLFYFFESASIFKFKCYLMFWRRPFQVFNSWLNYEMNMENYYKNIDFFFMSVFWIINLVSDVMHTVIWENYIFFPVENWLKTLEFWRKEDFRDKLFNFMK